MLPPESVAPSPLVTLAIGVISVAVAACIVALVHIVARVIRTSVLLCPRCWHHLDSAEFCGECGWNYGR